MSVAEDPSALLDTFVELADTLASGHEIGDLLQLLVDRCSELLRADTAGVVLQAPEGEPTMVAATSQAMLEIEDLEISMQQGPCLDAYRTGEQILAEDLEQCSDRWPDFTPRIVALGMRSAYAFPLRLRGDRIGALNLYRVAPRGFAPHEVRLAQALADIAAVGILQERSASEAERRAGQLQRALDSRILIEQAKGTLAERHQISPGEAFERLRRHARNNNMRVREVSRRLMDGELEL